MSKLALVCICAFSLTAAMAADPVSGEAVYQRRCSGCHEQISPRIPNIATLKQMPGTRILRTLDFGAMMSIAYPLNRAEREAVAAYIGTAAKEAPPPSEAFCRDRKVTASERSKFVWNGWSPALANTRFQSAEAAGLTIDQVRRLNLKWAFGFEGDVTAFAPPTVLDGQVFVGSAGGMVHALRAETGCLQWVFQARGPVRSAILAAPLGKQHALLFGDQTGWFYALEAETGRLLWKTRLKNMTRPPADGSPGRARGYGLCPSRFLGGNPLREPGLSVLHFPRQPGGAANPRRKTGVENLHHPGAGRDRQERCRESEVGAVGSEYLVGAHARPQAQSHLCHHRRQLLLTSHADQ